MEEENVFKGRIEGEKLYEVIEKCKFKPKDTSFLSTMNSIESKSNLDIVETEERMIDSWQYIIAAGDYVKYEPGDKVFLNLPRLAKVRYDREKNKEYEVLDVIAFPQNDVTLTVLDASYILGKYSDEKGPDISI